MKSLKTGRKLASSSLSSADPLTPISFLFTLYVVPETKSLTLEQVDSMLEETTPLTSAAWVPSDKFAHEIGLTEKGFDLAHGELGQRMWRLCKRAIRTRGMFREYERWIWIGKTMAEDRDREVLT